MKEELRHKLVSLIKNYLTARKEQNDDSEGDPAISLKKQHCRELVETAIQFGQISMAEAKYAWNIAANEQIEQDMSALRDDLIVLYALPESLAKEEPPTKEECYSDQ